MLMPYHHVPTFIYGNMKKMEYQASLQDQQKCIAFQEMLCAAAGCNSNNRCDISNRTLENAISPFFPKKQHK